MNAPMAWPEVVNNSVVAISTAITVIVFLYIFFKD